MEANLIESRAQFSFHLDGENEIDASLLSKTIADMAELTKLATREQDPDAYLRMNVTAFKNGSFQIDFSAVCQVAQSIYQTAPVVAGLALTVVGTVKGIFEIKKMLKGEKPKAISKPEDGKIEVEGPNGEKIKVPSASQVVINCVQADQLAMNISSYAQEHNPNGGFSLDAPDGSLRCEAQDIAGMVKPLPISAISTCQRMRVEAVLPIRKAVLIGNSKWGFDLNNHAIEATMADEDFVKVFQEQGSVKNGDYIIATLEVYIDLDLQGLPIKGTEKYTVLNVHGGIRHNVDNSTQESMF